MDPRRARLAPALGFLLALSAAAAGATDFYAAPNGSNSGSGSITSPWDLQTALNQPNTVHPGDTIWLRGGTYSGLYTSWLTGSSVAPIIVRQFAGERATLLGANTNGGATPVLTVNGSYAWYWGFEVTTAAASVTRLSNYGQWAPDLNFGDGVSSGTGDGLKLINLVVHDTRAGFDVFAGWTNTEIYGCVVYYNGYRGTNGPDGHGFYVQNNGPGYKKILDTMSFQNFGMGIQVYGSGAANIDNVTLDGDIFFLPGDLDSWQTQNFILGGGNIAQNPIVKNNFTFTRLGAGSSADFSFGYLYGQGTNNGIVQNNFVASGALFTLPRNMTLTGNTFTRNADGITQSSYPSNTFLNGAALTGSNVFVRPNAYEPGRANVIVYNWSRAATVPVDLSSVLAVGSSYEVRNVQNFFGSPAASGVYGGGTVNLPTSSPVSAPAGFATPVQSGPDFNAFVVLTIAAAQTPSPTPTSPSPTPTPTRTPTSVAPTATPTPLPPTPTPTSVAPTSTPTPTPTRTPTSIPPTATSTPLSPTPTPTPTSVPPTPTWTPTPTPTRTPTSVPQTATPTVPPPTPTSTPTQTSTPSPGPTLPPPTSTPTPTLGPPTPTPTPTQPPTAMGFFTVSPCRLVDTRGPIGPLGGPALVAKTLRTFVLAGPCAIPMTARALAVNVVVISPTSAGHLTLYPGGTPQPLTASINYNAGKIRANATVVSLGAAENLAVFCEQGSGTAGLVIDVTGYYQ